MALHSPKFDGHKIVLRYLLDNFLECSIEVFCDDCKTLKQIDKANVITSEKNEYLVWRILKTQTLAIGRMLSSMMMMIKAKLIN